MPLRISSISGKCGSINGHLFENRSAGVMRSLFWQITIPCAPVQWEDEEWKTSISCEWLNWSIGNWEELDCQTLQSVKHPESIECTYYLTEHHTVQLAHLILRRLKNTARFQVEAAGSLDISGLGKLDGKGIRFTVNCDAEFQNLIVVPDNLFPKPATPEEVTATLSSFISLENMGPPEWDNFRYVLSPISGNA